MNQPLISIIIPTHERPALLQRALASVANQSYANTEVLVVSDGLDPETRQVVESANIDSLTFIELRTPSGASAARNKGLQSATGEWVAFLDDDDEWASDKLFAQYAAVERDPTTEFVYCRYEIVSDVGSTRLEPWLPDPALLSPAYFLRNTAFNCSVPLIRRTAIKRAGGFDEELPGCQDKDLWVRLAARCSFAVSKTVLVTHHIHAGSMTTSLERKIAARELILEKHTELLGHTPDVEAALLERLGLMLLTAGDKARGREQLRRSAALAQPRAILRKALFASLLPRGLMQRYVRRAAFREIDGVTLYY